MTEIPPEALSIVGREAFNRVGLVLLGIRPPYGTEFAQQFTDFMTRKLRQPSEKVVSWLKEDLALESAQKGYITYNGTEQVLRTKLYQTLHQKFNEDLIIVVKDAIKDMQERGQEIPPSFLSDIELTEAWLQRK